MQTMSSARPSSTLTLHQRAETSESLQNVQTAMEFTLIVDVSTKRY